MPQQTLFVPCTIGAWVQICEYRETRKALLVQYLSGSAILGISTSGPNVPSDVGVVPCGVLHAPFVGEGPNVFRLSADDGDLVKQAWYAWVADQKAGAGNTPGILHASFNILNIGLLNGFWPVPNGVRRFIDCYAWGVGGSGEILAGGGITGGGGGAFVNTGPLAVTPGDLFSLKINGPGSNTLVVNPNGVTIADAGGGVSAAGGVPGTGGIANVGVTKENGGDGGPASGVGGHVGGGGGGAGGSFAAGTASVAQAGGVGGGANTILGFGAGGAGGNGGNAGGAGFVGAPFGGGGGGGEAGPIKAGGVGQIMFFWYGPSAPGNPVVTVLESFDDAPIVDEPKKFSVTLPKLSPDAIEALHDLLARMKGSEPPAEGGINDAT